MFPLSTYENRRNHLAEKLGKSLLIIPSYPERIYSNDTNYKYRPHSDVIYYTGFSEPDTVFLLENNDKELTYYLFVRKRDKLMETWNGRRYGVEGAKNDFGADQSFTIEEFKEQLETLLKKYTTLYYIDNVNSEIDDIIQEAIRKTKHARDREATGPFAVIDPTEIIHAQRVIKSEEEIEKCRTAASISAAAITKAMKTTSTRLSEHHIEALLEFEFKYNGAQRSAYSSIVGGGINAIILHYIENNCELHDGDLLLVDAGAEYEYYAADITRTWPVNGKFSPAQREIYDLVLQTQKSCIEMIKPGIEFNKISDNCISELTQGLIKLGLLSGDLEKLIEEKEYKRYFMHGLGHWLGIDTHDTSLYRIKEATLQKGNYLTIEPGIYIPDEDDIPEKYRGIGVRIEDDVLVTDSGYQILTKDVVKEIDEIESLVGTD